MANELSVSIIIPVYNAEKYLDQCISSVLNQTLKNIEVICIDDCSTDKSLCILNEFAGKDSRVKILQNEKQMFAGLSRNRGLDAARGEYVYFLDADDYMAPDACELTHSIAKENELDVIRFKAQAVDEESGENVDVRAYSLGYLNTRDYNKILTIGCNPKLFARVSVAPWSGFCKRSFLLNSNIRFNDLRVVNDRSFYIETITRAERIMFIDSIVVYHRINVEDSLVSSRWKYFNCHFKSYSIIEELVESLPEVVKRTVLENEVHDIFCWFNKFRVVSLIDEDIVQEMISFLRKLDITLFQKDFKNCRWYSMYYKLLEKRIPLIPYLVLLVRALKRKTL